MGAAPQKQFMINCRNCINWVDESLSRIEAEGAGQPHVFMGCRIYGFVEHNTALQSCPHYTESKNLFTICESCRTTVPKVCVSMGECVNCTDTDLFCVDHCLGGENRKYCTHFVRLHTEGVHLIENNEVFEVYPQIGMPGAQKDEAIPIPVINLDSSEDPE
jgi:hypothetical protein